MPFDPGDAADLSELLIGEEFTFSSDARRFRDTQKNR